MFRLTESSINDIKESINERSPMNKKNNIKKILIISLSLIFGVPLLIAATVIIILLVKKIDLSGFDNKANIHYYNDNENTGYLSTIYNDEIYYFSNEQDGINGIYRMSSDGSEAELVIECPDIKRITVNDDGLYFAGLYKTYIETYEDEHTRYGLFYSSDLNTIQRKAEELILVYDFFLFGNGFSSASERFIEWKVYEGNSYLLQDEDVLEPNEGEINIYEVYSEDNQTLLFSIKQYNDNQVYFIEKTYSDSFEKSISEYGSFVVGKNNNGEYVSYNALDCYNIRYIEESDMLIYEYNSSFYVVDLNTYTVQSTIALEYENPDCLIYSDYTITGYKDDCIYVKAVVKSYHYDIEEINYLKINYKNGNVEDILSLEDDKESVLYFDNEKVILKKGNKIYKYIVTDDGIEQPELLGEIDADTLDATKAGDWIFVYSGTTEDMEHLLLCKINVETGKTILNTEPFNSSQHDDIHVNEDPPIYYGYGSE